jgi:Cd2+/Zn2+-exporting ATPase
MAHQHQHDAKNKELCDTSEKEGNKKSAKSGACCATDLHSHSDDDGHNHEHNADQSTFRMFLPAILSLILLLLGIGFDHYFSQHWFTFYVRLGWYGLAYLPVGIPVLKEAFESITKGDVFSEFLLMCIATVGAFTIGEYPEGVAVMLFYTIGEVFQTLAVSRAKSNIKSLLDQRPDEVNIVESNTSNLVKASDVALEP